MRQMQFQNGALRQVRVRRICTETEKQQHLQQQGHVHFLPSLENDVRRGISLAPPYGVCCIMPKVDFIPSRDGFHFANRFTNVIIPGTSLSTHGRCGGMAWAALDYY